jgi:hypothetical protein
MLYVLVALIITTAVVLWYAISRGYSAVTLRLEKLELFTEVLNQKLRGRSPRLRDQVLRSRSTRQAPLRPRGCALHRRPAEASWLLAFIYEVSESGIRVMDSSAKRTNVVGLHAQGLPHEWNHCPYPYEWLSLSGQLHSPGGNRLAGT